MAEQHPLDPNDIVWVSPESDEPETGTPTMPFTDVGRALAAAKPGQTILLRAGEYCADSTLQNSGTIDRPINIRPETPGSVTVRGACWYLYDASDLVITGIAFRDCPGGALSAVGASSRNSLRELTFVNCGLEHRPACTLFFGGAGAECNVIEQCSFTHDSPESPDNLTTSRASVALILGNGSAGDQALNRDFVVRDCVFTNYGYAVIVGTSDNAGSYLGHVIERNRIEDTRGDAITVRCSDTIVRANQIVRTGRAAVTLTAGSSSVVENNRIVDCETGVQITGQAHTVQGNCLVRCGGAGMHVVAGAAGGDDTGVVLVHRNTLVDCSAIGVLLDSGTSAIVDSNHFAGPATPYTVPPAPPRGSDLLPSVCSNNALSHGAPDVAGATRREVTFADPSSGDYSSDCPAGASGWVLDLKDLPGEDADEEYRVAMAEGAEEADEHRREVDELLDEEEPGESPARGYFFPDNEDTR